MSHDSYVRDAIRRTDEAAQRRRERRVRRREALGAVALWEVLDAAAASRTAVVVDAGSPDAKSVTPIEVTEAGFVARTASGGVLVMSSSALRSVTVHDAPGVSATPGNDAGKRSGGDVADLVRRWIPPGTEVTARSGATTVSGRLVAIGSDVLVVATATATTYLSVASLSDVSSASL